MRRKTCEIIKNKMSQDNQWMCRACAQRCEETAQINGLVFFHSKKTIYTELTTLEAFDDDDLPKCLCSKCSDLLDQFKCFKETCIRSVQVLRNTIILNVKEEIQDISELLPLEVKVNESNDDDTSNGSHFDFSSTLPEEKSTIQDSECIEKSSKRQRKPAKRLIDSIESTKKVRVAAVRHSCLVEGCGKSFLKLVNLEGHQLKHAGVDRTICSTCNKKFSSCRAMTKHKKIHDRVKSAPPPLSEIDLEFGIAPKIKKKYKYRKPGEKSYTRDFKCTHEGCKKNFQFEISYEAHMKTHKGEYPFPCEICGKPLASRRGLKRHLTIHKPVGERQKNTFKCDFCGRIYSQKETYKAHMHIHEGLSFMCDQCGKSYPAKANLRSHMLSHLSAVPIQCTDCDKTFMTKISLCHHIYRYHRMNAAMTVSKQCLICEKKFKNQKLYHKHCKSEHTVYTTTDPIFDCQICSGKFKTKDTLRNHLKTHTNERNFICPECPKTFNSSATLKKHSYFHSGERPVHCEICNKGFYQKCALDIHMNVHKRQWIAEGQQGITLHVYPRNKKKPVE